MSMMIAEIYEALVEAGTSEEKAKAAAACIVFEGDHTAAVSSQVDLGLCWSDPIHSVPGTKKTARPCAIASLPQGDLGYQKMKSPSARVVTPRIVIDPPPKASGRLITQLSPTAPPGALL